MIDFLMDTVLPTAFALFFAGIIILGVAGIVDAVQDRRSFDAKVACEAKRMTSERPVLSTRVVCVPITTRQDTTTVNLRAGAPLKGNGQ